MARKKTNLPVTTDSTDSALQIMSALASAVPYLGGPISSIASGIWTRRQLDRLREFAEGLAEDLADYESEATEKFVNTEGFEELFVQTLDKVRAEVNEEKRRIWRAFLVNVVKSPGEPYDETIRFMRSIEQLQGGHITVIRAMMQEPDPDPPSWSGAISATLVRRISGMPEERILDLLRQLQDMRIAQQFEPNTMMTARGAEDLRNRFTQYGSRLIKYILGEN